MNKENEHISCDVCRDLIPLVQDHVASNDSKTLVYEHIATCESCKAEFENINVDTVDEPNDGQVMNAIRKSLFTKAAIFLIGGIIIGVYLSDSSNIFYNLLLMPVIGGGAYWFFKRYWYLIPVGVFAISFTCLLLQGILDGAFSDGFTTILLWLPWSLSLTYTGLAILGMSIVALIKFALKKEEIK